jgi:ribosomal protein S18 acetylase RimI-like enzyme
MASKQTIRALRPDDADAVVRIDRLRSGRSRTEFYSRRFLTLAKDPRGFVAVAAEQGSQVVGFAFARVLDGEFGGVAPAGALDAIGVAAEQEREGVATALLAGLEAALAAQGVRALRTQVEWTEHGTAAFFGASGFRLSPRIVLERSLEGPAEELADEALPVRSMTEADLPAITRLDRKITGRDRSVYVARKAGEVLRDTIGVDPAYGRRGVGVALLEQLLRNLGGLRAERVITEVEWNHLPLLGFLGRTGFVPAQRLAFDKVLG